MDGRGEIAERIGQRPVEILVDLAARRRPQEQRDADIDRAGRERRDDRLDASINDDAAIDEAGQRADREAYDNPEQDAAHAAGKGAEAEMQTEDVEMQRSAPGRPREQIARETSHHGHDGADGEIQPRRQHRHGLGHRQHGECKDLVAVLHQNRRREALGVGEVVEQIEDGEQQDGGDDADVLANSDGDIVKHGRLRAWPASRRRCSARSR